MQLLMLQSCFSEYVYTHCKNNTGVSTYLTETLGPKLLLVWTVSLKKAAGLLFCVIHGFSTWNSV